MVKDIADRNRRALNRTYPSRGLKNRSAIPQAMESTLVKKYSPDALTDPDFLDRYNRQFATLRKRIGKQDEVTTSQACVWLCVAPSTFGHETTRIKTDPDIYTHRTLAREDLYRRVPLERWWKKHMGASWLECEALSKQMAHEEASGTDPLNRSTWVNPLIPILEAVRDLDNPEVIVLREPAPPGGGRPRIVAQVAAHGLSPDQVSDWFRNGGVLTTMSLRSALLSPWADDAERKFWLNVAKDLIAREHAAIQIQRDELSVRETGLNTFNAQLDEGGLAALSKPTARVPRKTGGRL